MSSLGYFVVDAFQKEKYAGNQLAVFVDSGDLANSYEQRIAKETNYLGTTANFDLRFPILVSTGIPFVWAPAKTLAGIQRAQPRRDQYIEPKESLNAELRDCLRSLIPSRRCGVGLRSLARFGELTTLASRTPRGTFAGPHGVPCSASVTSIWR